MLVQDFIKGPSLVRRTELQVFVLFYIDVCLYKKAENV